MDSHFLRRLKGPSIYNMLQLEKFRCYVKLRIRIQRSVKWQPLLTAEATKCYAAQKD